MQVVVDETMAALAPVIGQRLEDRAGVKLATVIDFR